MLNFVEDDTLDRPSGILEKSSNKRNYYCCICSLRWASLLSWASLS